MRLQQPVQFQPDLQGQARGDAPGFPGDVQEEQGDCLRKLLSLYIIALLKG